MLEFLSEKIVTSILPFVLVLVGGILWVTLRFFPIVRLKTVLLSLFSKGSSSSSWRALSVALAGTLGVGNIVGIAYALKSGGAGAIFWMWVSSLFAMILKYGETVLAMLHRQKHRERGKTSLGADETYVGGAMYYIPSRTLAAAFAALCIASSFTVGNLLGTSAATDALTASLPISAYAVGILLAALTFLVTFRGIKKITDFCSATIPFLSLVYLLMCAAVLFFNRALLPSLLTRIVTEAFSMKAFASGSTGSVFFHALREGFSKGLVTNEAGCGTAPIAHASSSSESAVRQGFLGIVEVFFDTVVLCTASALVILPTLDRNPSLDGYSLVLEAFSAVFGRLAAPLLSVLIFFFVLATLVGWSYYGKTALAYLSDRKAYLSLYLLLFSLVAFLGAIGKASVFWTLADLTLGLMTLINVWYLFRFRGEIADETERFFQKR